MKYFPRRYLAVFILALAAGGAAFWWWSGREEGARVILIGLDGLDNRRLDRLIAEGKLPAFARLREEGAWGDMRSETPMLAPPLWTSVATGRPPAAHGVYHYFEFAEDGATLRPASSAGRTAAALWNIASKYGRRTGVLGWPATHPAERVKGFVVSDAWRPGVKSAAGLTHPESLAAEMARAAPSPARADAETLGGVSLDSLSEDGRARAEAYAAARRHAEALRLALTRLHARFRPDLLMARFDAPDAAAHLFAPYETPAMPGTDARDAALGKGILDREYEFLDLMVSNALALADARTVLIVCSAHGFFEGPYRPGPVGGGGEGHATEWHRPEGVVMLRGPGVRAGARLSQASLRDVAPTVLALMGIPLSREFEGKPLWEALDSTLAERLAARSSVEKYAGFRAGDSAALVKRLGARPGGAPAADETRPRDVARLLVAMGAAHLRDESVAEARHFFERAVEADPSFALAHFHLGLAEAQANVHGLAVEHFMRAAKEDPAFAHAYIEAARVYEKKANVPQALAVLDWARHLAPWLAEPYRLAALLRMQRGLYAEAEATLRDGLERVGPPEARAYFANMLGLLARTDPKRHEEAAAHFRRAEREYAAWFEPPFNRGLLLLERGEHAAAVPPLERAVALQPSADTLNHLARAYLGAGERAKAADALRRSLMLRPDQRETEHMLLHLERAP